MQKNLAPTGVRIPNHPARSESFFYEWPLIIRVYLTNVEFARELLHCVNFFEPRAKKNHVTLTRSSFILSLVVNYTTYGYKHASPAAVR